MLAAALLAGCASTPAAPASPTETVVPTQTWPDALIGKARVLSILGDPTYSIAGTRAPLSLNLTLVSGTSIKTGPDSDAYLHINGRISTIMVHEDTELDLTKMEGSAIQTDAATETILTLTNGSIFGDVKKLPAKSHYAICTPNGVAEIRGTDFAISATPLADGRIRVTFTCFDGQLLVTSTINGVSVTKPVATDQQWTPGEGDVSSVVKQLGPSVMPPPPLPPVILQRPYNNGAPPNPAVDVVHPVKGK